MGFHWGQWEGRPCHTHLMATNSLRRGAQAQVPAQLPTWSLHGHVCLEKEPQDRWWAQKEWGHSVLNLDLMSKPPPYVVQPKHKVPMRPSGRLVVVPLSTHLSPHCCPLHVHTESFLPPDYSHHALSLGICHLVSHHTSVFSIFPGYLLRGPGGWGGWL